VDDRFRARRPAQAVGDPRTGAMAAVVLRGRRVNGGGQVRMQKALRHGGGSEAAAGRRPAASRRGSVDSVPGGTGARPEAGRGTRARVGTAQGDGAAGRGAPSRSATAAGKPSEGSTIYLTRPMARRSRSRTNDNSKVRGGTRRERLEHAIRATRSSSRREGVERERDGVVDHRDGKGACRRSAGRRGRPPRHRAGGRGTGGWGR